MSNATHCIPWNADCSICNSSRDACEHGRLLIAGCKWCDATAPMPDDSTCSTCHEPQNAAGYCTNKQCSRHGRRNDYLGADASPGQTHYEGCERTAGHHRCAVDALDRAREALRVVHDELYGNASVSLEFASHDLTSKRHHTELTVGLVSEAQESIKRALAAARAQP